MIIFMYLISGNGKITDNGAIEVAKIISKLTNLNSASLSFADTYIYSDIVPFSFISLAKVIR